jgi:hypothetical protein
VFTVDSLPPDHFKVHVFTGKEALSEPYAFELVVTSDATRDEEIERLALGQRAVLSWTLGESRRAFHGVLAAVELEEIHEAPRRAARYRMRLVPRLWLLKRKRRTRIFQQMSVRAIVTSVLAEAGIATRWQLLREYPLREYCTQYEESDYRFVVRLLAESGIYFPLTGKENDESAWRAPVLMRYAGTHDREGTSTYRVALTSGTAGKSECDWMPDTIVLSCRLETIAVRRAGTAVMLDHTSEGWSSHWASSAGERVAGLRCEGLTNKRFEWPLVFVAPRRSAPGIEWAFQHDDIVQAGALRWMPALE